MKKNLIKLIALTGLMFIFSGCGPKIYEENQTFGRGINGGYIFDTIDNDRFLIEKIKRNNADYFEYKLRYGANKLDQILTNRKEYNTKKAATTVKRSSVVPKNTSTQSISVPTSNVAPIDNIMLDIAKDRR